MQSTWYPNVFKFNETESCTEDNIEIMREYLGRKDIYVTVCCIKLFSPGYYKSIEE